tara:strand:+ start:962 stop:1864 length:903 start_codon:yes stop_codon:yes gene_type:complete
MELKWGFVVSEINNTKDRSLNFGGRKLPSDITSYDLLKTIAVVLMIIDHIGMYFFPDDLWWRSMGRLCVPIWFFLIGYARSRDLPVKLWAGALLLVVADVIVGRTLLPLNILFTIMAVRLLLDPVMRLSLKGPVWMVMMALTLVALVVPSSFLSEYGILGLIAAMYGYMVRHRDTNVSDRLLYSYMVFAFLIFIVSQQLSFGFDPQQLSVMTLGILIIGFSLLRFKSETFPELGAKLPPGVIRALQFGGRRTLEIYVAHLVAFKCIALALGLDGYGLFEFEVADDGMFQLLALITTFSEG